MRVEVIDNGSRLMADVLAVMIGATNDLRIAVAFVSQRGVATLRPSLDEAIARGAEVEFLVGLDFHSTEPQALRDILELTRESGSPRLYCYGSLRDSGVYHPKLYLSRTADLMTFVVGSSNLTEGGLKRNVEINLRIEAPLRDEMTTDIVNTYNRLKFHPDRVVPDDEFIAMYAELCEREKKQRRASDRASSRLLKAFREKTESLERPRPTRRDLVGWLELVYDALPEREFTNQELYQQETYFQQQYPDNLNIRAKIRQQLQVLDAMGFVEHLGPGRWRKVI